MKGHKHSKRDKPVNREPECDLADGLGPAMVRALDAVTHHHFEHTGDEITQWKTTWEPSNAAVALERFGSESTSPRPVRIYILSDPELVEKSDEFFAPYFPDEDEPELYYIQNVSSVVGNCALWWRHEANGYTVNLDDAWLVTKEKADDICRSRPKQDIPRRASEVRGLSRRHVDVQGLRE